MLKSDVKYRFVIDMAVAEGRGPSQRRSFPWKGKDGPRSAKPTGEDGVFARGQPSAARHDVLDLTQNEGGQRPTSSFGHPILPLLRSGAHPSP